MTTWDAKRFYEENKSNLAAFTIRAGVGRTLIDGELSDGLRNINEKGIGKAEFLAVVQTASGEVGLAQNQYRELLAIQAERDAAASG